MEVEKTTMIRSILFSVGCLICLTMSQCSAVKGLSNPDFIGEGSYYQTWVAGVQGGGSGLNFYIDVQDIPESVTLMAIYFKDKKGAVIAHNGVYSASFLTDQNSQPDVIMHSDPLEEAVNTPPTPKVTFPFELGAEEAGISYEEKGMLHYAKISKVENKGHIALPSAPPQTLEDDH